MKTTLKIAAAATGACAALALGSGTASAFTVNPVPGGTDFRVNHGEAVALSQVRVVGPLLNPLYPHMVAPMGDVLQTKIDFAATHGDRGAGTTIYGPLQAPSGALIYTYG
ncbi:hypothetical protein GS504_00870 [Rhodococcus hoagii]|nr:hypothetical protein [Prescottella equi]